MGSDRARRTLDEARQYRRVVPQQGRVILEADLNEASEIAGEDVRREMLDIIGPAGVPSDPLTHADGAGYAITSPVLATRDFSIGKGVIYVGGWRVAQPDAALHDAAQPDWLDRPAGAPPSAQFEHIALRLREQEVSAVEDTTLREVALGGPDTAARVRLVRRVERRPVSSGACAAFDEVVASFTAAGLVFDPSDLSLTPTARLAVGKEALSGTPGPCDPAATDGFLGAENQMIRIQIAGGSQLLWAYDNASALYRVDVDGSDATHRTLALRQVPVDAFHQPKAGQFVEILRAAVDLGGDAYAAATTGFVTTLASAYQPDGNKIVLTAAPPAELLDPAQTRALFVRVWENRATFAAGTPVPLVDQAGNHTGLQVTLTAGPFIPGTFWSFAVRPTTPTELYPARYASPQPPEGPREWVCPLGVIHWASPPTVTDCRLPFDDLVKLTELARQARNTGCCTVTVGPSELSDARTLQSIIDGFRSTLKIGARVTICLKPGVYELKKPLRLGADHSGLAIEGCHGGAVIQAAQGFEREFVDGLIVLVHANEVTLRGLRLHLPQVPFATSGGRMADLPYGRIGAEGTDLQQLNASIGIRPVHSAELTVQDCLFRYTVTQDRFVYGVGIFAGSESWGHHVIDNKFVVDEGYLRHEDVLTRVLFGYVLAPTVTVTLDAAGSPPPKGITGGSVLRPLLTETEIRGNLFSGLIAGALIVADCGTIRIEDNRVRESYGGLWLMSVRSLFDDQLANRITNRLAADLLAFRDDPIVSTSLILSVGYPPPPGLSPGDFQQVTLPRAVVVGVRPPVKGAAGTTEAAAEPSRAGEVAEPAAPVEPPAAEQPAASTTIANEELALAMRFAAATQGRILEIGNIVGEAIGFVLGLAVAADKRDPQVSALRILDNDVDLRTEGVVSSCALVVWDDEIDPQGSVVVSANRLTNASLAQATALIIRPRRIAITGNLMANDTLGLRADPQLRKLLAQLGALRRKEVSFVTLDRVSDIVLVRFCLVVLPTTTVDPAGISVPIVAITGNVLEGQNQLPLRPGTLLPWDTYNTVA
ncbi:MAG TPA: DUF6519 domain-containing protein [Kofleriaceae bacterium]|nr:DUF6519 domain-containing protein [Kofleriaceae bacterium]